MHPGYQVYEAADLDHEICLNQANHISLDEQNKALPSLLDRMLEETAWSGERMNRWPYY